jgi:hypothetical protein
VLYYQSCGVKVSKNKVERLSGVGCLAGESLYPPFVSRGQAHVRKQTLAPNMPHLSILHSGGFRTVASLDGRQRSPSIHQIACDRRCSNEAQVGRPTSRFATALVVASFINFWHTLKLLIPQSSKVRIIWTQASIASSLPVGILYTFFCRKRQVETSLLRR